MRSGCESGGPERTTQSILVHPRPRVTWDGVFATTLVIESAPPEQNEDDVEET